MDWRGRHYWIVGASDGLGLEIARALSRAGATLTLSARRADRLESLARDMPATAHAAPCDVRDMASVRRALEAAGPIDGLVYCAGVYEPMPAQQWDAEAVEAMCDINFTGAARVLGAALPAMVARGHGHIVLIGSLSGLRGLPSATGYGASKAGLIHMAESLRADLPRGAFNVQIVNPGFIRTRLTDKNSFRMPFLMTPEDAARRVVRIMEGSRFRSAFPRRLALIIRLLALLPDAIYFRLVGSKA